MTLIFKPINDALILDAKLNASSPSFVIASMYTPSYSNLALRLLNSVKQFENLDFVLFEIPTIHKSISPKGSDNTDFCKPNFIAHCLSTFKRPILYLDCDVVVKKNPVLIEEIVKSKSIDFSIFNWLNDQDNAAYIPHKITRDNDETTTIYHFSHSIDYQSADQLICSGAVQFWNNSEPSFKLLSYWKSIIEKSHGAQDDHCLDYAFNNFQGRINTRWLTKSYARYAWWIFDEPIIDHPQIPYGGDGFKNLNPNDGTQRIYTDRLVEKRCGTNMPRGFVLNVNSNGIYRITNKNMEFECVNNLPLWI